MLNLSGRDPEHSLPLEEDWRHGRGAASEEGTLDGKQIRGV